MALSWTAADDMHDGFRIERDSGSGFVQIQKTEPTVAMDIDAGLNANSNYRYRIPAFNENGSSEPTDAATASTLPDVIWNLDLFPEDETEGWLDEWLGFTYDLPDIYPWTCVSGLGWFYVAGDSHKNAWLQAESGGWFFAAEGTYPFCYFVPSNSWIYHYKDTPNFYNWDMDRNVTLPNPNN